jgi:hypothetical protein
MYHHTPEDNMHSNMKHHIPQTKETNGLCTLFNHEMSRWQTCPTQAVSKLQKEKKRKWIELNN